eukprot:5225906-Lingulodinium_polyedra.AAC.1
MAGCSPFVEERQRTALLTVNLGTIICRQSKDELLAINVDGMSTARATTRTLGINARAVTHAPGI